jgi:heavy metal translocating P-type ATPase
MPSLPTKHPIVFDEFFEMGLAETASPFLTVPSRKWAKNLPLKNAFLSAFLLIVAFILSFFINTIPITFLFLTAVYFFAGVPSLIDSIEDISKWEINIDVLMTLAAFLSVLIGSPMEGALLLVLFALSGAMEDAVAEKAKGAISSLYKLAPTKALVINEEDEIYERAVRDVEVGMRILIKPGEIVPLDGVIIKGVSALNLVHLTGESIPLTKKEGDQVPAGARNVEGALVLSVTHISSDSTLSKIIQLVTQAQEARPPWQRWFDKVSKRYASLVIFLTAFFALTLPFIFSIPFLGVEGSVYRSIAFLIAASPCALIIATPIAYLSALGSCARQGILLKGGMTLDALANCTLMAFDKTGTLTKGTFICTEVISLGSSKNEKIATAIAGVMEKYVNHPIATAIVEYANLQEALEVEITDLKAIPGYGVEATVGKNSRAYIGNFEFIHPKLNPSTAQALIKLVDIIRTSGDSLAILLLDEELFIFRCVDTLRPHVKKTLETLKEQNIKILMLTGDHAVSANKIAKQLNLDEYYSELKPEDKLLKISALSQSYQIAMVGDGINDAPSLARATVGIAMGKIGSGTAIQAADVVLLHDSIELLPWLISKARKTQRIVRQNLFLAFSVIIFATTPALLGLVPLWAAVLLHEGGTILVGINALRLIGK